MVQRPCPSCTRANPLKNGAKVTGRHPLFRRISGRTEARGGGELRKPLKNAAFRSIREPPAAARGVLFPLMDRKVTLMKHRTHHRLAAALALASLGLDTAMPLAAAQAAAASQAPA